MALGESLRAAAHAEFMREESHDRQDIAVQKEALRAAFDATDDWLDANSASFNSSLPQPARGALTARQKAKLLAMVLHKRFGVTA